MRMTTTIDDERVAAGALTTAVIHRRKGSMAVCGVEQPLGTPNSGKQLGLNTSPIWHENKKIVLRINFPVGAILHFGPLWCGNIFWNIVVREPIDLKPFNGLVKFPKLVDCLVGLKTVETYS